MNKNAIEKIVRLYYETEIPYSDAQRKAYSALSESLTSGRNIGDALSEAENESMKQGFLYGFQCAARMHELLAEVSV